MVVTKFLTKKELSKALNYSEKEIDDLVLKRQIPYYTRRDGTILFPMEEVLAKFTPRKKSSSEEKKKTTSTKAIKPEETATPNLDSKEPF